MRATRIIGWAALAIGASATAILAARLIWALPSRAGLTVGATRLPATTGRLATAMRERTARHPDRTGVFALHSGTAAFATRVLLADAAAVSIDVQYYIWHRDLTGLLLLATLRRAADRGVAVRLLLDDNGIAGLDQLLVELDAHPNIAVRLYNPFPTRRLKPIGYAFDFLRLNRRMHNKSFTVDGVATVLGGRNVGDEYFGTGPQPTFVDLDVLATGAIVPAVSADFARYWNSASAYGLAGLITRDPDAQTLADAETTARSTGQFADYARELAANDTVERLAVGDLPLEWTIATLVSDAPVKTLGLARRDQLLVGRIDPLLGQVAHQLDIISPYFVPGKRGVAEFAALTKRGVRVRVLTNALEATDVLPVHAGYAKYRHALLAAGIELYELKHDSAPGERRRDAGLVGSSGSSLHAKTFAADGKRIYVGSFNFDPRSVELNTEMGLVIDSPAMADAMAGYFDGELGVDAYVLSLDRSGAIRWDEQRAPGRADFSHDPHASWLKRVAVAAIGTLPIQWLL